jgi:hypothetical protein
MRALALSLLLAPSIALAQVAPPAPLPAPPPPPAPTAPAIPPGYEPSECTTTTTVRCTGAAAPYAVQAAQPQTIVVPAPPPAPAPAAPPQAAPPTAPPAALLLDTRLGDGWRLVQAPDGSLWRERKVSSDAPAVWGTGMALWLGGYFAGAIGGMHEGGANMLAWWPIIGAFINTSFNSGTAQALWAVDGLVQTGGFVTFLVGLAAGPDKLERRPLAITPATFVGGGNGVALTGRF